ncbi:hypothetical protein ABZ921_34665 [Streptomyces atriruber]|uniref:Rod shape-determining protein RodA n=1 Tax=Streptomyces atriruber TaxID=545121 RepID=A0ABV3BXQ6_9ACTN
MAALPEDPRPKDPNQDTRLYLLLLTILISLVVVTGTIYLSYQHPRLATPIQTGGMVATVLMACAAVVIDRR